jgi:hypothetical protein
MSLSPNRMFMKMIGTRCSRDLIPIKEPEMKKIRILFYVTPRFKWKYKVNWLISLWTRSKYSHCELWVPNDVGFFDKGEWDYMWQPLGLCYTSTMRGDHNGTVKRPASEVLDHPEHWEYVEVELADDQYELLTCIMNLAVGQNAGYATWDILKFLSPVHFSDNKRYICSEFCNDMLVWIEILKDWGIISPKKLHKKLTKLGYETKSLKG